MKLLDKRVCVPHGKDMDLFCFGDLQFGAKGFDERMWQELVEEWHNSPNPIGIGLGDYSDTFRGKIRVPIQNVMNGDRSSREQLDEMVKDSMEKIYQKMKFMKGKIIGLHSGHHEWEYLEGGSTTMELCRKLECAYLTWTAYTVLKISTEKKYNGSKGGALALKIYSTHGSGGGGSNSGDLANLEKKIAPFWNADIYLRGHSSRLEMTPLDFYDVTTRGTEPRLIRKTRWLVNTGGFDNGYTMGEPSYVEKGNMPPACQGWAMINIKHSTCMKDEAGKNITGFRIQPILKSPPRPNIGRDEEK